MACNYSAWDHCVCWPNSGLECVGPLLSRPYAGAAVRAQIRWKVLLKCDAYFAFKNSRDQISALAPFEPRRGIFGAYRVPEFQIAAGRLINRHSKIYAGVVNCFPFSARSTARSFAGLVALALADTAWSWFGVSRNIWPVW